MANPAISTHFYGLLIHLQDNIFYAFCDQIGHLIGPSGIGKVQLTHLIEAILRPFREHDETEYKKLVDWQCQ